MSQSALALALLDHLDDGDAGLVGPDGRRLLLRVLVRAGALLGHVHLRHAELVAALLLPGAVSAVRQRRLRGRRGGRQGVAVPAAAAAVVEVLVAPVVERFLQFPEEEEAEVSGTRLLSPERSNVFLCTHKALRRNWL